MNKLIITTIAATVFASTSAFASSQADLADEARAYSNVGVVEATDRSNDTSFAQSLGDDGLSGLFATRSESIEFDAEGGNFGFTFGTIDIRPEFTNN